VAYLGSYAFASKGRIWERLGGFTLILRRWGFPEFVLLLIRLKAYDVQRTDFSQVEVPIGSHVMGDGQKAESPFTQRLLKD